MKYFITLFLFLCMISQAFAQDFITIRGVDYKMNTEIYVIGSTNLLNSKVIDSSIIKKDKEFNQNFPYNVDFTIKDGTDFSIFMTEKQLNDFLNQVERKNYE